MSEIQKKPDRVAQSLTEIYAFRDAPRTPEALAGLRRALTDKSNFVVAAAAEVVAAAELAELAPLLSAAFARFMISPAKTDKNCKAKIALADALYRTESQDDATFRIGLRHVQPEPIWGGQQDTAAELRGICAMALAQLDVPGVIEELADLLADPEPNARVLCARALGASGREAALPLLRYKVRIGDAAPEVLLECFAALLALSPERALPLCAEVLKQEDEALREAAALALGQSRREEALPLLIEFADRLPVPERRVALVAMAMLRSAAALEYLMELLETAPQSVAIQAAGALAVHRYDDALKQKVQAVAERREEPAIRRAIDEAFAGH